MFVEIEKKLSMYNYEILNKYIHVDYPRLMQSCIYEITSISVS